MYYGMLYNGIVAMCEIWYKLFRERTIGRDKGESRRNRHRKIEGKGDKRGWSCVNRSWLVCLSDSVPYHCSLSYALSNPTSKYNFYGCTLSSDCVRVGASDLRAGLACQHGKRSECQ